MIDETKQGTSPRTSVPLHNRLRDDKSRTWFSLPFPVQLRLGRQNAKNWRDAVFCPSAVGFLCLKRYLHTCASTISMAI